MASVMSGVVTTKPSSQPILSFSVRLSLGNALQPLYRVQVEEEVSLRLGIYDLWNRADDCRAEDHRVGILQPDPRRLMAYNGQSSSVAKIACDDNEDSPADEFLQPVKYCG